MAKTKQTNLKTKLSSVTQAHGQLTKPTTLNQVFGFTGKEKYGTLNEIEYSNRIEKFDQAQLREECVKRGIIPILDNKKLKSRLLSEFRSYAAQYIKDEDRVDRSIDFDHASKAAKVKAQLGFS